MASIWDLEELSSPKEQQKHSVPTGQSIWDLEANEPTVTPEIRSVAAKEVRRPFVGLLRGIADPFMGLVQASAELDPMAAIKGRLFGSAEKTLGIPLTREGLRTSMVSGEKEYQVGRDQESLDVPRLVGNVVGSLPISFVGGAGASPSIISQGFWPSVGRYATNRAKDFGIGVGMGVSMPTYNEDNFLQQKMEQAKLGGLGAMVSGAIIAPISRMIAPNVSSDIQRLREMGVTPTIGQRLGPMASRTEQALTSAPLLGGAITEARKRSIEQFNVGVGRQILNDLNPNLAKAMPKNIKAGHDLVDYIGNRLGDEYDRLLPKLVGDLTPVRGELAQIQSMTRALPDQQMNQFDRILQTKLYDKFNPQGMASGETLKEVESELGRLSRGYMKSPDFDHQQLGDALREVQSTIRKMVEQSNPQYAGQLQPINRAWSQFLRLENAAARAGAAEGVFSPAQLRTTSKVLDPTRKKSQFARGTALLQPEAELGSRVLGATVPDSGTALRSMTGLGILGGSYALHPGIAVAEAASMLPYTALGQHIADTLMSGGAQTRERLLGRPLRMIAPAVGGLSPLSSSAADELNQRAQD